MKIFLLASAEKIHTFRWATWLSRRGYVVSLLSDRPAPAHFSYGSVRLLSPRWTFLRNLYVYKVRGGPFANNAEKWRAWREVIERGDPDILHASEALAYGPTLHHFPRYTRVLTPWGPDMEMMGDESGPSEARALVRQACHAADIITTNAPGLEARWAALSGVPEERFHNFSWGTDTSVFRPAPAPAVRALRQSLRIPPEARVVLSPRLAKPLYRIDVLVEGWKRAAAPGAMLVVLRAGADDASWATVRETGDETIRFVDRILSPSEMATMYSSAEAVAMLPRTDLVASSLLEGLGCGCLPILGDLPCYRQVTADLSDPADGSPPRARGIFMPEPTAEGVAVAVRRWVELPADRIASLRAANIAHIELHESWEHCAEKMEEAYLLAQRNFIQRQKKEGPRRLPLW